MNRTELKKHREMLLDTDIRITQKLIISKPWIIKELINEIKKTCGIKKSNIQSPSQVLTASQFLWDQDLGGVTLYKLKICSDEINIGDFEHSDKLFSLFLKEAFKKLGFNAKQIRNIFDELE